MRAGLTRWYKIAQEPVDIASLVVFRVAFGLLMCAAALRFFWYNWIDALYTHPRFFFTYYGFSWVTPLPSTGMKLLFAALAILGFAIAIGAWTRISTCLFLLIFTYVELLDKTNYLNHYYLVSLLAFLLLWVPAGRAYSLDAWRRRGEGAPQKVTPRWCLWCLRGQLGLVYLFAGLAKLNTDWLLRGEPLGTWLRAKSDFPLVGHFFVQPWCGQVASIAGACFDLGVVFCLLSSRLRPIAYMAVLGFHIFTWLLFPIGMFPWLMMALTLIFFSPDWPRRCLGACKRALGLHREGAAAQPEDVEDKTHTSSMAAPDTPTQRWLPVLLGGFFLLQLLLPMRSLLYPGDVRWHEQGFRFSWRVMLIEKNGDTDFILRDPVSGKRWRYSGTRELTPLQVKMMSTQPDMILTYAHHLAQRFRAKGYPKIQVFAQSQASLNGRRRQVLVDPKVDLAQQPRGFGHKPWIVPLRGQKPLAPGSPR